MPVAKDIGEIIPSQFEWEIKTDQLRNMKIGDKIYSPKFTSSTTDGMKISWQLSLSYSKGASNPDESGESGETGETGETGESDGNLGLFLGNDKKNDDDNDVVISYTLSLLNNNRKKIFTWKFKNETIFKGFGIGPLNFVSKFFVLNPINEVIKNNHFTILCTLNDEITEDQNGSCQQMIESMFKNKNYSDVTIVSADGIEFCLHKNILAAQSSVFKAMFDIDMAEKKDNLVKIDDFDSKLLNAFFKYLYTAKFDDDFEDMCYMMILAEKYNVEKLIDECELILCLSVNISNAFSLFKLAEMTNAKKLRSNVIHFMALKLKDMIKKPEFKSLPKNLIVEITECHLNYQ